MDGMRTSLPAGLSAKLNNFLAECNKWQLLDNLNSLMGRIWITYSMHHGMQQVGKWLEIMEEQIKTGVRLLKLCEEILDGDSEEVDMLNGEGFRELWRGVQQVRNFASLNH
jgi:hypothetical protein